MLRKDIYAVVSVAFLIIAVRVAVFMLDLNLSSAKVPPPAPLRPPPAPRENPRDAEETHRIPSSELGRQLPHDPDEEPETVSAT